MDDTEIVSGPPAEPADATIAQNLQRITEVALDTLDLEDLLAALLDRVVAVLRADTAAILLLEEDGTTLAARAAKGLEEEVEQGFRVPVGKGFAGRVAATRAPVVAPDITQIEVVNPILREKGLRSIAGVPLIVSGRLIGVLHVGALVPRDFTPADVELLKIAAERAAVAIEHGRLLQAEREARARAERAATELAAVARVTEAALAQLGLEDLLRELLTRIVAILHADTAAILLVTDDGTTLAARAASGLEEEVERGFQVPIGRGFAGRVAAERAPVVIEDLSRAEVVNPLLREKGLVSLVGVPLIVESRLIGVLHVGTLTARVFTHEDVRLLQIVADRAALAIEHDRLFEQQRTARLVQQSLLPKRLPSLAGVALAARYLPAATEAAVGGDWYDVIPLPEGRIGLAIGDVVGHGGEAAGFMGQLRNALRAYALLGDGPAVVASRLAGFAESLEPGGMATFLYGELDPEPGTGRFVSAGHPPPLLVSPDGSAELLDIPPGPPLGASMAVLRETQVTVPPGTTLVLYTDGLVERRTERLQLGFDRLIAEAGRAPFDPELLSEHLVTALLAGEHAADDVAVLAIQHTAVAGEDLRITVAARAEELASTRRLLRRWLEDAGAGEREASGLILAVGEACANAIEHAYGPADAAFELCASRDDHEVTISVRDFGRWRAPRGTNRGRGLMLMRAFTDDVAVERADDGTLVRLSRRLVRSEAA